MNISFHRGMAVKEMQWPSLCTLLFLLFTAVIISKSEARPYTFEEDGWPEPGPEWEVAKEEWQEAWPIHVYLCALAFLCISFIALYIAVSFVCVAREQAHRRKSQFSRTTSRAEIGSSEEGGGWSKASRATVALMVMVMSFSAPRFALTLVDPYYSRQVIQPFVYFRLLWSLPIPGFSASFSIVLLILLDTTKLSLGPPKFQQVTTIVVIWVIHVVFVLFTDMIIIYTQSDFRIFLVICQGVFILYGVLVSLGYLYVGMHIRANLRASLGYHDEYSTKLRRLVLMTFLSSFVAFSVAVLNVYTAFSEFGPYSRVKFICPWPFWIVQTLSRILEVAACSLVLMLYLRSDKVRHWRWLLDHCLHPQRNDRQSVVSTIRYSLTPGANTGCTRPTDQLQIPKMDSMESKSACVDQQKTDTGSKSAPATPPEPPSRAKLKHQRSSDETSISSSTSVVHIGLLGMTRLTQHRESTQVE